MQVTWRLQFTNIDANGRPKKETDAIEAAMGEIIAHVQPKDQNFIYACGFKDDGLPTTGKMQAVFFKIDS